MERVLFLWWSLFWWWVFWFECFHQMWDSWVVQKVPRGDMSRWMDAMRHDERIGGRSLIFWVMKVIRWSRLWWECTGWVWKLTWEIQGCLLGVLLFCGFFYSGWLGTIFLIFVVVVVAAIVGVWKGVVELCDVIADKQVLKILGLKLRILKLQKS